MLRYAVLFIVIAIVAAVLGFGLVVGVAAAAAKVFFVLFLIFAVVALIRHFAARATS